MISQILGIIVIVAGLLSLIRPAKVEVQRVKRK